jgi:hypothetical protein
MYTMPKDKKIACGEARRRTASPSGREKSLCEAERYALPLGGMASEA